MEEGMGKMEPMNQNFAIAIHALIEKRSRLQRELAEVDDTIEFLSKLAGAQDGDGIVPLERTILVSKKPPKPEPENVITVDDLPNEMK